MVAGFPEGSAAGLTCRRYQCVRYQRVASSASQPTDARGVSPSMDGGIPLRSSGVPSVASAFLAGPRQTGCGAMISSIVLFATLLTRALAGAFPGPLDRSALCHRPAFRPS